MTRSVFRLLPRVAVAAGVALSTLVVAAPPAHADKTRDAQWYLKTLRVAEAHRITQGAGVTVALIDTGVDAKHPDLTGAILPGNDFAIHKAEVSDGLTDLDGHGTAMAGLIAGHGHGSGSGILGIAPQAKVLSVRTTEYERPPYVDLAINWAIKQKVQVINLSIGSPADDTGMREAVQAAQRADIVVVASAGNTTSDKNVAYPAAYPGVIAVGGVDRDGRHAVISVTGPEVVLTAPGVDLTSSWVGKGYDTKPGTSRAAAIVSGAVALVRAKYPQLSAPEVIHRLTATADDKGAPGRDDVYGYGVLNLVKALTADVPPLSGGGTTTPPATDDGPPVAAPSEPKGTLPTSGLLIIGAGCVLLTVTVVGMTIWLITRRRRNTWTP